VPAIFVSAYTSKGAVIGADPNDRSTVFDHTSVLASVEKLFKLRPLTNRDAGANTLEVALDLLNPRVGPTEAPLELPFPAPDSAVTGSADVSTIFAADPRAPLSINQKAMAALALACDLAVAPPESHPAIISNHQKLVEQQDAANYIQNVESKILDRRAAATFNPLSQ
jgi:phospholipase C